MPEDPGRRSIEVGDGRPGATVEHVLDRRRSIVDLLGYRRVLVGVLVVAFAVALGFLAGKTAGSVAKATKTADRQVSVAETAVSQVTTTKTVIRQVTASRPTPSAGPFNQVIATGARCSDQKGHQLQLGVEVRDELDIPITLIGVRVPYAAGDELRPMGSARGACGELPGSDNDINGYRLEVGTSVWLTVTVGVLTGCPAALHPTILLDYSQTGHAAATMLDVFPDLGDVPYTGCH